MFKWDRLIRRRKSPIYQNIIENDADNPETALYFEDELGELTKDPERIEEFEIVEMEILPAKIICPDCGGITLEGLDFCDKCGGEI